jgi:hypothetical protein
MNARMDPALLHDSESLRISRREGEAARHIVSFTGISFGLGGLHYEEWGKSLSGRCPTATYVTDKERSWYNATREAVIARLRAYIPDAAESFTLGNSMGGFGALYFAGLLPGCRRAIAFAPQFSIHPDHMPPDEHRWAEYRGRITAHRVTHALEHARPKVEYVAFFGSADSEQEHAARLAAAGTARTHVFVVDGSAHEVALDLKRAGVLPALLDLLLASAPLAPGAVLAVLRRAGIAARLEQSSGSASFRAAASQR